MANKQRRMACAGCLLCTQDTSHLRNISAGKSQEMRSVERLKRRWIYYITMGFKDVHYAGEERI
jgi:hypothetical protein